MTPAVRHAEPGDLPAVERLLGECALSVAGVAEAFRDFLVAEADGDGGIVGTVGLELYGEDALLRSAAVGASHRGTGLGRSLVERILEHAGSRGVRSVYLLTTTAEGWFPRFGFRRVAREHVPAAVRGSVEFREICPSSATVMVAHLP